MVADAKWQTTDDDGCIDDGEDDDAPDCLSTTMAPTRKPTRMRKETGVDEESTVHDSPQQLTVVVLLVEVHKAEVVWGQAWVTCL